VKARSERPLACVLGDIDLVRPLGLVGIKSVVLAAEDDPVRFSRFTVSTLDWRDHWTQQEAIVETLLRFGRQQQTPPVLFYEADGDLLLISRHRRRLESAFRFVIADDELVEDILDKGRFQSLAERLGLEVPRARRLRPDGGVPELDLEFPIVLKPVTRRFAEWSAVARYAKAVELETPAALRRIWPAIARTGADVLAQEVVPGPESRIESYHVYVDAAGRIAGDFTGRKIRTYPPRYGQSTALVLTDARDVASAGRRVAAALRLRGIAKIDFKRAPDGTLRLLEVNPRFNLWHHLGARAGVNLPALVYADLAGLPRPPVRRIHAGATWCSPWLDLKAARASGVSLASWIQWLARCDAKSLVSVDDPLPLLRGLVWPGLARTLTRTR
jgi:D-aspartate ligase